MMISGLAYDDLVSKVHACVLHEELPVVVDDTLADDEWAYRTSPSRLEVSLAIMEELKAWKGPIGQRDLERILGSTKKKHVAAMIQMEVRDPEQLKDITK